MKITALDAVTSLYQRLSKLYESVELETVGTMAARLLFTLMLELVKRNRWEASANGACTE